MKKEKSEFKRYLVITTGGFTYVEGDNIKEVIDNCIKKYKIDRYSILHIVDTIYIYGAKDQIERIIENDLDEDEGFSRDENAYDEIRGI